MQPLVSRLVTLFLVACAALSLPARASAQAVPHLARGSAQFLSLNDFVGTGIATHLGRYTEKGRVKFSDTRDENVKEIRGFACYTAANGDELYAVVGGTVNMRTGVIAATLNYVGGTGRFADATGSASLDGQMFPGGAVTVTVAGTIDH